MFPALALFLLILTTDCVQDYRVLGFSSDYEGHASVWIIEDVAGECNLTQLKQVSVDSTGKTRCVSTHFKHKSDTIEFCRAFRHLETLLFETFRPGGDNKINFQPNATLSAPAPRGDLLEKYLNIKYLVEWNKGDPAETRMLPVFTGCRPEFLYASPDGLYFNYSISQVHYCKANGLLTVFTQQPMLAPGGDTMHGFMVFRVK